MRGSASLLVVRFEDLSHSTIDRTPQTESFLVGCNSVRDLNRPAREEVAERHGVVCGNIVKLYSGAPASSCHHF